MAGPDITVMGAGAFGLAIAFECARRGANVTVCDPAGPGGGASGGVVGALAPHVPENWNAKKAFQLESLLAGAAFWADVEAQGGTASGYGRTGRLQPLPDERAVELAKARSASARTLWQGKASWHVVDASAAGAFAPQSPTGLYVYDTLSARLHPRQACTALAAAVTALGGRIVPQAPLTGAVIWATGHQGLADLSHHFGAPVGNGVKGQAALLAYDAGHAAPQIFADTLHFVPHADGTLAVGSTTERDFTHDATTDTRLEALIQRARLCLPAISDAPVLQRWAGVRPRAKSRAPILGPWPDRAGHFIANGGFKIGFGLVPGVAKAMAQLVLDGNDNIPDAFRPEANL